jgi:hypothetical protein
VARILAWIRLVVKGASAPAYAALLPTPHSSTQAASGWTSQTQPSTHWPQVSGAMRATSSAARVAEPSAQLADLQECVGEPFFQLGDILARPEQLALESPVLALEVGHCASTLSRSTLSAMRSVTSMSTTGQP